METVKKNRLINFDNVFNTIYASYFTSSMETIIKIAYNFVFWNPVFKIQYVLTIQSDQSVLNRILIKCIVQHSPGGETKLLFLLTVEYFKTSD